MCVEGEKKEEKHDYNHSHNSGELAPPNIPAIE